MLDPLGLSFLGVQPAVQDCVCVSLLHAQVPWTPCGFTFWSCLPELILTRCVKLTGGIEICAVALTGFHIESKAVPRKYGQNDRKIPQ
eukprot:813289-Amphidinium_carterae.2